MVAIGGIDGSRARTCISAGASGVAAIDAFIPPATTNVRAFLVSAVTNLRAALQNC